VQDKHRTKQHTTPQYCKKKEEMMEAAAHSSSARAETTQWAELTSMLEEMEVRQQRGNDAEKAESQADGEEGGGSMVGPHQLSSWRRYYLLTLSFS
jgi:hypothetical protein